MRQNLPRASTSDAISNTRTDSTLTEQSTPESAPEGIFDMVGSLGRFDQLLERARHRRLQKAAEAERFKKP